MFLTNQPFQRGWETQKNRPLIKVSALKSYSVDYRIGTITKLKTMCTCGITLRGHLAKRSATSTICLKKSIARHIRAKTILGANRRPTRKRWGRLKLLRICTARNKGTLKGRLNVKCFKSNHHKRYLRNKPLKPLPQCWWWVLSITCRTYLDVVLWERGKTIHLNLHKWTSQAGQTLINVSLKRYSKLLGQRS